MKDIFYGLLAGVGQSWDVEQVRRNGEALGRLLWRCLPERREMACKAIAHHMGLPPEQARETALQSFQHNGRSFLEIFLTHRVDPRFMRDRFRIADPQSYEAMRTMDRPCVAVTGHLGAWEMLGGVFHMLIPDRKKQIVVRRPKDQALHELTTRLRAKPNQEVLDHRNAVPKILRGLKKGGTTAFLVDHNTSTSEAVFLPFLKNIAAVNMGPALLALRSDALIQPVFLIRDDKEGIVLHSEPYLDTRTLEGSREEKVLRAALFYTQAVERMVRRYPEQWYWLHKRWKTQPPQGWTYVPPQS